MNKLVLLDSNSILNRAFYALPPLSAADGTPTNAVLGYVNILIKIIKEIQPTHIIAAFDVKAPTFRKKMYDDYKAQRKPMPEELAMQLPIIKKLLKLMKIQVVELPGFEADDIIGTLSKKCSDQTIIVTGDKDSLQLVSDSTTIWLTKRGVSEVIEYTPSRLLEDGLLPSQVIDLKSLMGDASDNIPGVSGVGEKTAMDLLSKYSTLDGVYEHLGELKGKLKERLEIDKDMAYLSFDLATINIDSPIDYVADDCILVYPFDGETAKYMEELNFKNILTKIDFSSASVPKAQEIEVESIKITSDKHFAILLDEHKGATEVAIYLDGTAARIAYSGECEYVLSRPIDFFDELNYDVVTDKIKEILEDCNIKKYIYDIKSLRYRLDGVKIVNAEDVCLIAYLLKAHVTYKGLADIANEYGAPSTHFAAALMILYKQLYPMLQQLECESLYRDLELPLVDVLFDMEKTGVKVDTALMKMLGEKYFTEITQLTKTIYGIAGEEFNINSPKQLGHILFDVLGLRHGKKNSKSGAFSTNVDTLELLKNEHEIITYILRYREISKLLSTYINGLEPLLDGNMRLHTIFKQMLTATGRLSSTEPNLQNIPVRKEEGRELRKMFVAGVGNKLVCADYSQIELRLLAHFSEDETLIDAFKHGADIHAFTAAKVYGIPQELVTADMRSRSKSVNFGIIYGISDFGLAQDIGCSPREAKMFIEQYFATYPRVKKYLESSVEFAKVNGFVRTLLGRVRFIPDIKSTNFNVRGFGERVAKNMPLQGSASDIIKVAMIKVSNAMSNRGLKAKMVLQVHDELIIDCPNNEVTQVSEILKQSMQLAATLRVPLIADVKVGDSWFETK